MLRATSHKLFFTKYCYALLFGAGNNSDCSNVGQQEVLLCRSVLSLASSVVLMEPDSLCRVEPSVDPHGSRNEEMYE